MGFVELSDPTKRLQQQMMVYEMMRKGGVSRGDTETDKFFKELEDQRRWKTEEGRKERVAGQQITASQEESTRGQKKLDVETDLGYRKDVRDESETAAQNALRGKQGVAALAAAGASRASATASYAHAGLLGEQTAGARLDNTKKQNDALLDRATRGHNFAMEAAHRGEAIDPIWTNQLEEYERRLSGDQHLTLPRNEDGSWKYDKDKIATSMYDEKGMPRAAYAKTLDDIAKKSSPFGQMIDDFNEVKANGGDEETLKAYRSKIWEEVAPTVGKVEGAMIKPFVDHNDIDGAMDLLGRLREKGAPKITVPNATERVKMDETINLIRDTDRIKENFVKLKQEGKMPVGFFRQPWNTIRARVGSDDQEITTFLKQLDQFRAKYVYAMTGKQMGEKERADLSSQIFNKTDSPQTFWASLPQFRNQMVEKAAVTNGIAKAYGMEPMQGVPIIDPGDVIAKGGKLPDFITESGYVEASDVENHIKGIRVLADKTAKGKAKIGSVEERRDWTPNEKAPEMKLKGQRGPLKPEPEAAKTPEEEPDITKWSDADLAAYAARAEEELKQKGMQ
jgi:hypothetical protein